MQRAGPDKAKVGQQRALVHLMLYPPHQMLISRHVLVNYRGPLLLGVVHQQVGLIATEDRGHGTIAGRLLTDQRIDVLGHVLLDGIDVLDRSGVVTIGLAQLLEQRPHRGRSHLLVKLLDALLHLLAPARHLLNRLLQFLLQHRDGALNGLATLLGQRLERLHVHHLAFVVARRKAEAMGRLDQGNVILLGLLADLAKRLALALTQLLLDFMQAALVLVALEGGRNGVLQLLDQLLEITSKPRALSRG